MIKILHLYLLLLLCVLSTNLIAQNNPLEFDYSHIDAYKSFVSDIRAKYPKANIICALGSMDATKEGSSWPGYVQTAVKELNDEKMYTLMFPYKNTPGHPKVDEHKVMAKLLIAFIDENIKW
ncbi:hypothetical protein [Carboxylicivirga sp. N1Y90]|uniref:hypothetical protein n=1 Tax=Carboxylicivirga fragile TaxID=3417571 RepID=UPI003D32D837|nr:hypothetical protein [Marinilabiliaceae bacterium N1Y90]